MPRYAPALVTGAVVDQVTGRRALREFHRARRRRYLEDVDWIDSLYKAYITALIAAGAIFFGSRLFGTHPVSASDLADVLRYGPAALGLVVALAVAAGLRSGTRGGPLALEAPDVTHILLAPDAARARVARRGMASVPRRRVRRRPARRGRREPGGVPPSGQPRRVDRGGRRVRCARRARGVGRRARGVRNPDAQPEGVRDRARAHRVVRRRPRRGYEDGTRLAARAPGAAPDLVGHRCGRVCSDRCGARAHARDRRARVHRGRVGRGRGTPSAARRRAALRCDAAGHPHRDRSPPAARAAAPPRATVVPRRAGSRRIVVDRRTFLLDPRLAGHRALARDSAPPSAGARPHRRGGTRLRLGRNGCARRGCRHRAVSGRHRRDRGARAGDRPPDPRGRLSHRAGDGCCSATSSSHSVW